MKFLNIFKPQKRRIFLSGEIKDQNASVIVAKLLEFDKKPGNKDIELVIDSPGGSVTAAFAIYDTIRYIKSDVNTIVIGQSCGMALLISTAGTKRKRAGMKNSTYALIPFESGNINSRYSEKQINEWIGKIEKKFYSILSERTGQTADKIKNDVEDGLFLSAEDAIEYGFIDIIC